MKIFSALLLIFCLTTVSNAQGNNETPATFIFLPKGLQFAPLKANIQEARVGVFKFTDASHMKVDIGNSIDLFGVNIRESNMNLTLGIDFMAYAFVTGNQGLRLQIDAVDGFFGGNISLSTALEGGIVQARLRILHHSAHLVDGHYSMSSKSWLDNRGPIPFTQDFGELVAARIERTDFGTVRYYGGLSYATLIRPAEIKRISYLGGMEISTDRAIYPLFGQPVNLFGAYNLTMNGTPVYAASHQAQAGVKFGKWQEKGITIYLAYYTGRHMFSEYFDERITTIGAGFTVDFF